MSSGPEVRERWLELDGRAVRHLASGRGPPVVLIHGLGLSGDLWSPHLARLASAGYRALAPDLPGFGRSDGPATGRSVAWTAAWLERWADAAGVQCGAWVGHSLGAQHVVRLAVAAPERVAALVLAAPTGRQGLHALRQFLGLVATAPRERRPVVAHVLRRYLLGPAATLGAWLRSLSHDMELDAPKVACPTLVVRGEADPLVPQSFVDRLVYLLPDATSMQIEGAAHAVALDPADTFADAVAGFLARRYRCGESTRRWNSSGMASRSHGSSS